MNFRKLYLKLNDKLRRFTIVKGGFNGFSEVELLEFAKNSPIEADLLYKSRNVVWKTNRFGRNFIVKTFGSNIINSLIYTFRKSKAKRSYEHGLELRRRGINTPQPIGFVEVRGLLNILSHSCYACDYTDAVSLFDAIEQYGESCLAAFAGFVAHLHKTGIRHDDLNDTNVRVSIDENMNFLFSLIDLNRMKILPLGQRVSIKQGIINTCRFYCTEKQYEYFAKEYLEACGISEIQPSQMVELKQDFERKFLRRKRILRSYKHLLNIS